MFLNDHRGHILFQLLPTIDQSSKFSVWWSRSLWCDLDLTFHSFFHYLSFIHLLADQIEPINICQWLYAFRLMLGQVLLPSILVPIATSTIPPFFKPQFKGYFNPLIDIISSLLLIPIKLCLPQSASHIPFYHYLCSLSSLSICKDPYLTCIFVC